MAELPPVPLRTPVCEPKGDAPDVVVLVLGRGWISRDFAVFLNALRSQIALLTPAGTFANNAAAIAGGLSAGQVYQTAAGEVRVVV